MFFTATLLPLMLQAGLDPTRGGVPDYSADIQDRPPRELSIIDAPQPTSWLASVSINWKMSPRVRTYRRRSAAIQPMGKTGY